MKFISSQKDLNYALDVVSKAITPNNTLPVLNNILIKATGSKIFFSSTNLEIAIHCAIQAEVVNEGSITVPAKLITSYIALLEDEKVEVVVEEGFTLSLKSKNSHTKIKGISADEFPLIPKTEKEYSFTISPKTLAECIDHTVFSAANSTTRPVLSGVYLQVDKDELKMVATDSYRLAEKKIKLEKKSDKQIECIIPVRTLLELQRILGITQEIKDTSGEVHIQGSKNQIMFTMDGVELTSRLIEGKFPDYEKIIPRAVRTKLEVNSNHLSLATKRVSLFAKENNNSIKIRATNDGKLQVFTDETRVGEEKAEIDVKMEGENQLVGLNAQYMLDVLSHLGNDVIIELNEKLSPLVVKPLKNEDYLYLIMPLKI